MIKKITCFTLISVCINGWSAQNIALHQAPLNRLNQFTLLPQHQTFSSSQPILNALKPITQVKQGKESITRYQQFYKGIPVIGAQVTLSKKLTANLTDTSQLNGHLLQDIELNITPTLSANEAFTQAKKSYQQTFAKKIELQIREAANNQMQLVYLVSFKSLSADNKPVWPHFIIDAHTGEILKQWNNIQTFSDEGPGGNEKTGEYWYGKDGLPGLEVSQDNQMCTMDDNKVELVNLHSKWDWQDEDRTATTYTCTNTDDLVNGAFSVSNDAYYFGHTIINLYKDWYDLNALQDEQGQAQKLIMRVHFGSNYVNAFWDGETMAFGDGDYYFYPLVSLDVAAHEVSHGFTQQHANLEYHDQSGALNESFSDMAAQAARAYLLEREPNLYNKTYLTPNQVTWGIGETLIKPFLSVEALRFMDIPSKDGESADCVDKSMARNHHSICAISYNELLMKARNKYPDADERQSYIVHTASGIFNRAFYLMAQQVGIKTAFQLMVRANVKYWTPTSTFTEAACGVLYASDDLNINRNLAASTFNKVGIDTQGCSL